MRVPQKDDMSDIQKRIAEHNKQFKKAAPTFEPRHASLKEVKAWEQRTGLKYSELNHDQREAANKNIKGARAIAMATDE